ncbi:MAG: DUF748 domain-containing protein [Candidatus Polarisedimenticolaceae bacterium]|nr:DUF748 domain-containing protein [Candidatus Polarisedimenticolaceae bacterium]
MPETSKTSPPSKKRHYLAKAFLSALLLISTVIWTAPLAIEWAVVDWLKKSGVSDAAIEDIELNPFTGEFSLSHLSMGLREGRRFVVERLYLKLDYLPLYDGRVEVRSIELSGVELDLKIDTDEQVTLGSLRLPNKSAEPVAEKGDGSGWHFGLDQLLFNNIYLRTDLPQHRGTIQLNHLKINHVASWLQQQQTSVALMMLVDGAKVAITTKVALFKPEPEWRGRVVIEMIDFENYAELSALAGVDKLRGLLSADLQLDGQWLEGERLALAFDGDLNLLNLQLKYGDIALQQGALAWRGEGALHYPQTTPDEPLLTLQSHLALTDTSLELASQQLIVEQKKMEWDGVVQYQEDRHELADGLQLKGDLMLTELSLIDHQSALKLASWQRANLQGLAIDGLNQIHAEQLKVVQLTGLGNLQPSDKRTAQQLFAAKGVVINNIALQQLNNLSINEVELHGMQVALLRNKKGDLKWLTVPAEEGAIEPTATESEPQDGSPFALKLAKLSIDEDSSILFQDAVVEPAYQVELAPFQLVMQALDTTRSDQPTTIMVKAEIDKYSTLDLSGTLYPFQKLLSTDLQLRLKGIDLTTLSPYAIGAIGYDFRRGRLDSESSINIDHGKLELNNALLISKLTIIEADSETAANFSQSLVMPLDAALGILRDSEDNIAFDLPVTGDLSAPEFSLSGVVNLALTNALKSAAMSYLTNALQPLGTVLLVYDLLEKATEVRFKSLEYGVGSSKLAGEGRAYADKVATLLHDRQELKLTLCGVVNSEDQMAVKTRLLAEGKMRSNSKSANNEVKQADEKAIKKSLLEMAERRSRGLKGYLVEQGVAEMRLFTCRPMIDLEAGAKARVELSL